MILFGIAIALSALIVAWAFNSFYPWTANWIKVLEYLGYICWSATLGTMDMRTWNGKTPAELLDQNLAKIFSLLGIFVFVMARELTPIS